MQTKARNLVKIRPQNLLEAVSRNESHQYQAIPGLLIGCLEAQAPPEQTEVYWLCRMNYLNSSRLSS